MAFDTGERVFFTVPRPDPIPLHRITLDELMACKDLPAEWEATVAAAYRDPTYVDGNLAYNPRAEHLKLAEVRLSASQRAPFAVAGFEVAYAPDETLLAVYDAATGAVAGGIERKNIYVAPEYRGRGIGPEILVLAFEVGIRHPAEMNVDNTLSRAGRANRVAAHRLAVERALEAGEDVPEVVLEDYPDLAAPGMGI